MTHEHNDAIFHDHNDDGVDRRGFLKCMAWAGTGALWLVKGGVLESLQPWRLVGLRPKDLRADLSFVQISDSHIGFNQARQHRRRRRPSRRPSTEINALPTPPAFMLHTGDMTHLAKPEEFDTVQQILKARPAQDVFYVPGRARRPQRRRQGIPGALRQRHAGQRLAQLRQQRRAFHRAGQRDAT